MGANHVSWIDQMFYLLHRANLNVIFMLIWEDLQESWQSLQCINLFQRKKNSLKLNIKCICILKLNSGSKVIRQIAQVICCIPCSLDEGLYTARSITCNPKYNKGFRWWMGTFWIMPLNVLAWRLVGTSQVAQLVKNLPVMQETLVPFLGWEDLLEKGYPLQYSWASLVAQLVKNLPAVQETWVWSVGGEDPLEKGKATLSSVQAWRIPWTAEFMWSQRVRHDWVTFTFGG